MKLSTRHAFALSLLTFAAAALSACAATEEEPSPPAPSELVSPVAAPAVATVSQLPLAEGDRPISAAELDEVRRAVDFAATTEILTEDGETLKLETGITSAHEASLNGVDITFTPLDAAGLPSRKNLQVVYQRSDTLPPHFFFVTTDSAPPSLAAQKPTEKPGDGPISSLCIGGTWSSWSTYNTYCGYRWLCSKRKWNNLATFSQQQRQKRCWNGNMQYETRNHFEHCGC
jgi:hypothetical protein